MQAAELESCQANALYALLISAQQHIYVGALVVAVCARPLACLGGAPALVRR